MKISLVDPYQKQEEPTQGNISLSAAIPQSLTRNNIVKELIRLELVSKEMKDCTLVTTSPRNYFIDLVLSNNQELYYDVDQLPLEEHLKQKRLIKLPFYL